MIQIYPVLKPGGGIDHSRTITQPRKRVKTKLRIDVTLQPPDDPDGIDQQPRPRSPVAAVDTPPAGPGKDVASFSNEVRLDSLRFAQTAGQLEAALGRDHPVAVAGEDERR